MYPLLETIKLKNGILYNLSFHNRRLNKTRKEYFGVSEPLDLSGEVVIPENKKAGLYRCRVIYNPDIEKIEFLPHLYREIKSLKLVEDNLVDYRFKFADRSSLQKLFDEKGSCDDILIVKNGCITDSSAANPLFYDGKAWWTPDTPLLKGTQRARLIDEGKIFECRITPGDLHKYEKVGLINAMLDMEDMPVIDIRQVF